jgi:SsrA-binding protein
MAAAEDSARKIIASNRKARHDYHVLEKIEAGMELKGSEVKSLRNAQASLVGSYARIEDGQVFLCESNIPPYDHGSHFNHEADRPRRLLLHRSEIRRLQAQVERQGLSLVPLALYFRRGRAKVELGLCRGKQKADKRETLRRRTADREAARAMASRRR